MDRINLNGDFLEKQAQLEVHYRKLNRAVLIESLIFVGAFLAVAIALYIGNAVLIRLAGVSALIAITTAYFWWRKVFHLHMRRTNEIVGISSSDDES